MARSNKSSPYAVRLSKELAIWVEEYVEDTGLSKTKVFEMAIIKLRDSERRRLNGKKTEILAALRNEQYGV